MTNQEKHASTPGHGSPAGYERSDLSAKGIIYFLVGLGAATIVVSFLLAGMFDLLDKRERASQPAVSPLATNVPTDTRQLPENYKSYLKDNFPAPQLEVDERTQLNDIRLTEEQTLHSYGWIDEKAGTVRIPIDRAMDLIAQRGLPVQGQGAAVQPQVAGSASASVSDRGPTKTRAKAGRKSGKKK